MMREGQTVFTYFHFAADRELTLGCLNSKSIAVAYETLTDKRGYLPLLTPMSEIAGKLSVQEGAKYLERPQGGPWAAISDRINAPVKCIGHGYEWVTMVFWQAAARPGVFRKD